MRIRALKLGQLSHPYRHLGNTGAGLAQESIRGKPGGRRLFLHILAQAHVNGIVVLGYIPVDVIQAAVPDLYVDFGSENEFEKLHECRYNGCPRAALELVQDTEADHPAGNVPVRCTAALILRLADPLIHNEISVSELIRKVQPDHPDNVIHESCPFVYNKNQKSIRPN